MFHGNIYGRLGRLQNVRSNPSGGVCFLELVPVEWISEFPDVNPRYNTITNKIVLAEDYQWIALRVPDNIRSLETAQKSSDAGSYFESTATCLLPLDSVNNTITVSSMRYYRYVIVVNLLNGMRKLLGDPQNPVRFSTSFDSGDNSLADPGRTLTFSWISENEPLVYMGRPNEYVVFDPILYMALGDGRGRALSDGTGFAIGHE